MAIYIGMINGAENCLNGVNDKLNIIKHNY